MKDSFRALSLAMAAVIDISGLAGLFESRCAGASHDSRDDRIHDSGRTGCGTEMDF